MIFYLFYSFRIFRLKKSQSPALSRRRLSMDVFILKKDNIHHEYFLFFNNYIFWLTYRYVLWKGRK